MKLPTVPIPAAFEPLDLAVDDWFEAHLRHRPLVDAAMYGASAVGDHGIVWLAFALIQARRRGQHWVTPLLRATLGLGAESAVVNGPVKWMFRRTRPVHDGFRPMYLRIPRTSSFPSGHATAAFFGAALLRDGDPWWPLYYGFALVVAASRVHVRIHHASDVIGGALLGVALGELVRRYVPVPPFPTDADRKRPDPADWTGDSRPRRYTPSRILVRSRGQADGEPNANAEPAACPNAEPAACPNGDPAACPNAEPE